jgi:5-methylcytosine-specific restriction endonuclease McrA
MLPKSRAEAVAQNKKHYYTGKPCKHGHLALKDSYRNCVECTKRRSSAYKKAHPKKVRTAKSLREKRHQQATPKWLKQRHKKEIRAAYEGAILMTELMGEKYVVDHIVPLNGKTVCGLHVPWNLRVITEKENTAKSNKLIDFP